MSLVSSSILASSDSEICRDDLRKSESVEQAVVLSVRRQCSPCGVKSFSNVNVERAPLPSQAAGSWQGWQSWGASSSSWDESKSDIKCQEAEKVMSHCTRVERSEGIPDVKIVRRCEEVGFVNGVHLLFGEVRSVTAALKVVEEV